MSSILSTDQVRHLVDERQRAINEYREADDPETQRRAFEAGEAARNQLDEHLTALTAEREDEIRASAVEARAAAARLAHSTVPARTDSELRDALDPKSKRTEFTLTPPNVTFRANELYTGDTTTTYSSYLFHNDLYREVVKHLNAASAVLEGGATVITTNHLRDIDIPVLLTDATANQTAELSPATQTYPVFDKVTLSTWRQDGYFLLSEEQRLASEYDLEGLLTDCAGRAIATKVAAHLASGAGTTEPAGIDTCTSSTVTTSQTTVASDECIATFMDLARPYQRNASFLVASGLYAQMLKWKDDEGNYLLRSLDGATDRFMGRPLYVEPALADPAHSTVPLVVGDLSRFFVRMSPIVFEIDKSLYFKEFILTARFAVWMDSQIVDVQALRSLTMA